MFVANPAGAPSRSEENCKVISLEIVQTLGCLRKAPKTSSELYGDSRVSGRSDPISPMYNSPKLTDVENQNFFSFIIQAFESRKGFTICR